MSLHDLYDDLGARASAAIAAACAGLPDLETRLPAALPVVRASKPEFGDFQISACLQLGKPLGKPPRELAAVVAAALASHEALEKVEVAGPGFVNLHVKAGWLGARVAALLADGRLGLRAIGKALGAEPGEARTVVIDYSSPNVAKPMHIGHIRSTIIGAALHATFAALGYHVIADNHLGDWGTQFGKLIVAYKRWLDHDAYERDPVAELERLYRRYTQVETEEKQALGLAAPHKEGAADEADDDAPATGNAVPPILAEARAELVALQQGDPSRRALWQMFVDDSRHAFESIYARLGVSFDHWLGESAYNDMLPTVVEDLVRRGIAVESQGAIVIPFEETKESDRPLVFIVRKADGAFNYATTDIATMAVRTGVPPWPRMPAGPFHASQVIVCTDERQIDHFKQLFAVARRLGVTAQLDHVTFGLMRFWNEEAREWEAGSTRKGNVIHLDQLLDEAERRAALVAGEHNADLTEAERREVGRVVGLGAVKYNDLSKDRQTLVSFTWDKALALTGNTAPYLQYAYARIRSIVRKSEGGEGGAGVPRAEVRLALPVERDLARRLLAYPEAVESVARTLRPHLLCDYLFELASAFSNFYNECPVLKAEPDVRASRLVLTELVSRVLAHGLSLLGIDVLERM